MEKPTNFFGAITCIGIFMLMHACSSDTPTAESDASIALLDAAIVEDAALEFDAAVSVDHSKCTDDYPITYQADPAKEAEGIAALANLSPGATMTWAATRGTFSQVLNLGIALDSCVDDSADLYLELRAIVDANPTLFQVESSEWTLDNTAPCSIVGSGVRIISINRHRMAGRDVRRDVMSFILRRVDGKVILQSLNATYLPIFSESLQDRLLACPDVDIVAAKAAAVAQSYPYTTFFNCIPNGSGTYQPNNEDSVGSSSEAFWSWYEEGNTVILSVLQDMQIEVDDGNITQQMRDSDANCPDPEGDNRVIGFSIIIDVVTFVIESIRPGIGCVVC